jgi:hypothetical protein
MWKRGEYINAKMEDKFSSMYHNGRMVQIGMYMRNQKIRDYSFKELYKKERNAKRYMAILRMQ